MNNKEGNDYVKLSYLQLKNILQILLNSLESNLDSIKKNKKPLNQGFEIGNSDRLNFFHPSLINSEEKTIVGRIEKKE